MRQPGTASGPKATYHIGPWRRWGLWLVVAPMLAGLLLLGAGSAPGEARALFLAAALLFLIALPFHLVVGRARLELSEEGVRLRQAGYALAAGWGDIADVRLERGREGFVTARPMAGGGAARLARFRGVGLRSMPLYDPDQRRLLAERRLIPIEAFAWHLRRGTLARDIARFAPHLAAKLASRERA